LAAFFMGATALAAIAKSAVPQGHHAHCRCNNRDSVK
jgi:hypothetical protein